MAHPQGRHTVLEVKFFHHLLKDGLIACQLKLAACHIRLAGLKSKHQLRILLVSDAYVHIFHQVCHDLLGLLGGPQFLTEV